MEGKIKWQVKKKPEGLRWKMEQEKILKMNKVRYTAVEVQEVEADDESPVLERKEERK